MLTSIGSSIRSAYQSYFAAVPCFLIIKCYSFAGIWSHFIRRLGLLSVLPKDSVDHLDQFKALIGSGRNAVNGARAVMFARIWKAMNNNTFETKAVPVELWFACCPKVIGSGVWVRFRLIIGAAVKDD